MHYWCLFFIFFSRVGSMSPVSAARLRASSMGTPHISFRPLYHSPSCRFMLGSSNLVIYIDFYIVATRVPLLHNNSPDVLELNHVWLEISIVFYNHYCAFQPEKRSSFVQSTFNSINVLCGLGLLSYPFALRCSGWSGILLLLFFTVSTFYTALVLAKCIEFR